MQSQKIIKNKKVNLRAGYLCRFSGILFLSVLILLLPLVPPTARASNPVLWDGTTAAGFAGGSGTETNPYLISNGRELKFFSDRVNAGTTYAGRYIKLIQDILLNEMNEDGAFASGAPREFTAIGSVSKPFGGHFDGAGYKITGLYIRKNWIDYQGLFGYAATGSEIWNIRLLGDIEGGGRSGGVAGYTDGLIAGCVVKCPVTANGKDYHGGITGYADVHSVISNCITSGVVGGSNYIGGIAGYLGGKVTACESGSAVNGTSNLGGLVGSAVGAGTEISNCSFLGTVTGNGDCVGGIAGQTEGLIDECFVRDATITGKSGTIGGIVGYAKGGGSTISNCDVSGTVKADGGYGYVGGVAGNADGTITGCTCTCEVTGTGQHLVGGIAGNAGAGSEISYSSSSGVVTGIGKVGGIAGYTDGDIAICINTGNVNGGGSGHAGGIAGEAGSGSSISNSYNAGDVDGGGPGGIGGIVGFAGPETVVHHNLNKGAVRGNFPTGSVIGNEIDPDNAWNNYYYDYTDAPGGSSGSDIPDDDGAVPVGELTWQEIQDLLNTNNEAGDDIWNQDADDDDIPKPGQPEGDTGPGGGAFEVLKSVIKAGKRYELAILQETGAAVAVTADSVFTAAFSLKYDASSDPGQHLLRLKNNDGALELPEGASVVMLVDGSYYYLNLDGPAAGITGVVLQDFAKMGSAAGPESAAAYYDPAPVAEDAEKEFLFIFDFSRAAMGDPAGEVLYQVELTNPDGNYTGTAPTVNITGKNNYALSISGAGGAADTFTLSFTRPESGGSGYDYKTAGKALVFEFYLGKAGVNGRIPLPVGAKLIPSGDPAEFVAAAWPYAFLPGNFAPTASVNLPVTLDLSDCAAPLAAGNYTLQAAAYACADPLHPRGGYLLAQGGPGEIALAAPTSYAIKASASARVLDRPDDSGEQIAVAFTIQTRGSDNVKATLQRKYGKTYVDVAGEKNKPVEPNQGSGNFRGAGNSATLTLPADIPKGTYRFLLTLYDESGNVEKAGTVQNIIVK